jgi:hypothetical protein
MVTPGLNISPVGRVPLSNDLKRKSNPMVSCVNAKVHLVPARALSRR